MGEWRPPPLAWQREVESGSAAALEPPEGEPAEELFPDVSVDVLFPRSATASTRLAAPRRSPVPADVALPSGPSERDGRAEKIESHLARRMRGASDRERSRLAAVILEAADWARLDPVLVLAMIEVESGFDPGALSNRGARGLMQLRPATLWREAALFGLAGKDPHEPELNVAAGALYFRRLLDAFGRTEIALMAYNAGPNRILGLIRAGGIPERFLEYPRRVRAAEERLRRSLALRPADALASRQGAAEPLAD